MSEWKVQRQSRRQRQSQRQSQARQVQAPRSDVESEWSLFKKTPKSEADVARYAKLCPSNYEAYWKRHGKSLPSWVFWAHYPKNEKGPILEAAAASIEDGDTSGKCKMCDCVFAARDFIRASWRSDYQQQCNDCATFINFMTKADLERVVAEYSRSSDPLTRRNGQIMWNWLRYANENGVVTTVRGCYGSSLFDTQAGVYDGAHKFDRLDSLCDWCVCDLLRTGKIKYLIEGLI